jgi:hypothetical protein
MVEPPECLRQKSTGDQQDGGESNLPDHQDAPQAATRETSSGRWITTAPATACSRMAVYRAIENGFNLLLHEPANGKSFVAPTATTPGIPATWPRSRRGA